MGKVFLAGVILEDVRGRIALQLRDDNPKIANPGMWSVFGGHIEENEPPAIAAKREMKEELSIEIDLGKLKLLGEFKHKNKVFYVYLYKVIDEMKSVVLGEGQAWQWCEPAEIKTGTIKGISVVDYHVDFLVQYWNGKR